LIPRSGGLLVLDDSVLDKPYARRMGLVGRFWSGKQQRVVQGIDLVTLLWTDGDVLWPCDYRLVNPADGKTRTKNDHFRALLTVAKARGLAPRLKQYCGVERAPVRHWDAQRNHIGCALRAFVRLEYHRYTTGISWLEAKLRVIREAVKAFLTGPCYRLPETTTA